MTAGSSGFDWGDAAIGAAGGIALTMIALGGTLAASRRRTRGARHATALPQLTDSTRYDASERNSDHDRPATATGSHKPTRQRRPESARSYSASSWRLT